MDNSTTVEEIPLKIFNSTDEEFLFKNFKYDAVHFLVNVEKNVQTAEYCIFFIKKLYDKLDDQKKSQQEKKEKNGGIQFFTTDDIYISVNILGEDINMEFILEKYIKDFIQYSRTAFEIMAQYINKVLFVDKPIKSSDISFANIDKKLDSDKKFENGRISKKIKEIKENDLFKYIIDYNNQTKHISDVPFSITWELITTNFFAVLGEFEKRNVHSKKDVRSFLNELSEFIRQSLFDLSTYIREFIPYVESSCTRIHKICSKRDGSHIINCVEVEDINDLTSVVEIYQIAIRNGSYNSKNCSYGEIFIRNKKDEYVGKLENKDGYIEDTTGTQKDLATRYYRKYKKIVFSTPKKDVFYSDIKNSLYETKYLSEYKFRN